MDGTTFAWLALGVWLVGGLAGYVYLRRHGHPHPGWLLSALVLGPFALLVFSERVERSAHVLVQQPSSDVHVAGGTTVLVGYDGSPDADHAVEVAQRLVGPRCCLVLCEVVDYDTEEDPNQTGTKAAQARLTEVAAGMPTVPCTIEVLAGRPAQALAQAAEQHDADLIVVGTHGRGLSHRLLGSVAEQLLSTSSRPVLITQRTADVVSPSG